MKRDKLLSAIFTRSAVRFDDVVTLLVGLGFRYDGSGAGSRVKFVAANGDRLAIHAPHPGNGLKTYQVKALREFLQRNGVAP